MTGASLNFTVEFVIETCCDCGVSFATTKSFRDDKLRYRNDPEKRVFYCPNGHAQHYNGKSDAERAREAEEEANRQRGLRRMADEEAAKARTQAKREATRRKNLEKRVAAGVCAFCHRTFQNVARHVHSKHPEKAHQPA